MSDIKEEQNELDKLREIYSEIISQIFNAGFNTKEYLKLDKEADLVLGRLQRLSFKDIPTLTEEDFKE